MPLEMRPEVALPTMALNELDVKPSLLRPLVTALPPTLDTVAVTSW